MIREMKDGGLLSKLLIVAEWEMNYVRRVEINSRKGKLYA